MLRTSRGKVAVLAALRLAAIYAAGVLLLAAPLVAFLGGLLPALTIPVLAVVGFLAGFIALAVARRVGFVILWSLLVLLWVQTVGQRVFAAGGDLLVWTVFAAPLYLITVMGLTPSHRRLRLEMSITLAAWAVVAALATRGGVYWDVTPNLPTTWDNYLCAVWPFVISGRELVRAITGAPPRIGTQTAT
jgi:hypothetical protein